MSKSIERLYHPYWEWEEIDHNMWGTVKDKQAYLAKAIGFTCDAELYGSYMLRVADEWPCSCRHNLSNTTQNRKAWIGHAACALAFQCPEDIVRSAWGYLTEEQQEKANKKADEAIKYWEEKQCQSAD